MAKLRHIAVTVTDLKKAAAFYEKTFELKVHSANDVAVSMSDGVFNLTLLKFPTDEMAGDERGKDFVGVHHFGFVVDDIEKTGKEIEKNGGRYHPIDTNQMATETKYRDPDGIVFDITGPAHVWAGVKL
jgi:catechol 2,3-dioxygenase-like lactoylglutathione lyase family enzyme